MLAFAVAFVSCLVGGASAWAASDVDGGEGLAPGAWQREPAAAAEAAKEPLPNGAYILKLHSSPTAALGVSSASFRSGASIVAGPLGAPGGTYAQKFYLERGGDGSYALFSVCSGLALTGKGAKVLQAGYTGAASQRFSITLAENGSYTLCSKSGWVLSASSAGATAKLEKPSQNAVSQQFEIVATDLLKSGVQTLRSASQASRIVGPKGSSTKAGATISLVAPKPGVGKVAIARSGAGCTVRVVGSGGYISPSGTRVKQAAKTCVWKVSFAKSGKRRGFVSSPLCLLASA